MIYFCILLSFFIAISIAQSCIEDWADFKVSKGWQQQCLIFDFLQKTYFTFFRWNGLFND